jgi:hypothetical protein
MCKLRFKSRNEVKFLIKVGLVIIISITAIFVCFKISKGFSTKIEPPKVTLEECINLLEKTSIYFVGYSEQVEDVICIYELEIENSVIYLNQIDYQDDKKIIKKSIFFETYTENYNYDKKPYFEFKTDTIFLSISLEEPQLKVYYNDDINHSFAYSIQNSEIIDIGRTMSVPRGFIYRTESVDKNDNIPNVIYHYTTDFMKKHVGTYKLVSRQDNSLSNSLIGLNNIEIKINQEGHLIAFISKPLSSGNLKLSSAFETVNSKDASDGVIETHPFNVRTIYLNLDSNNFLYENQFYLRIDGEQIKIFHERKSNDTKNIGISDGFEINNIYTFQK